MVGGDGVAVGLEPAAAVVVVDGDGAGPFEDLAAPTIDGRRQPEAVLPRVELGLVVQLDRPVHRVGEIGVGGERGGREIRLAAATSARIVSTKVATTTTRRPCWSSRAAAVRPAIPAPTTATSVSSSPGRGGYDVAGVVATHIEGFLSRRLPMVGGLPVTDGVNRDPRRADGPTTNVHSWA